MRRLCLAIAGLLWTSPVTAQAVVRLQVDNDAMVIGPRHDRDYTHGIDASIGRRRCDPGACRVERIGLVHALFTPNLLLPLSPPADRPFAGYIGIRGGLEHWAAHGTWQVTGTLGLRGPAALGEPLQRFIHHLFNMVEPPSWDRQLPTAPWLAAAASAGRWTWLGPLRVGALGGLEAGTMRTYVEGGLRLSVGADARWLSPQPVDRVMAGLGAELGGRWFAGDATLHGIDGGAGVPDEHRSRPWLGVDGTLRAGAWAATVSMSWLGKDFRGQEVGPVAGSARLQWTPGPLSPHRNRAHDG